MTDPSTGQPAVTRLLDQQSEMARTLTELQVAVGQINVKLTAMCEQRVEQHQEHVACLAQRECSFSDNEAEHVQLWKAISRLTTWGKAIAIVGSILLVTLGIISYVISIGGHL